MANIAKPFGFRPVQDRSGNAYTGKTMGVLIDAADTNEFGEGDLLVFTGESKKFSDGKYYSVVTKAAPADTRIAGAITGFNFLYSGNVFARSRPAGAQADDVIAYVPQDKDILYLVQASNGSLGVGATEANIDFAVGAVDAATGFSTSTIDTATAGTADTLPLRIVELQADIENEPGDFSLWLVTINQDAYNATTGL